MRVVRDNVQLTQSELLMLYDYVRLPKTYEGLNKEDLVPDVPEILTDSLDNWMEKAEKILEYFTIIKEVTK